MNVIYTKFEIIRKEDNMEEKKGKISKKEFISEIAKQARFTQSDISIVVNTIEDILKDMVRNRETFVWAGMFKLSTKVMPEHAGYNAALNEPMIVQRQERVTFTPSRLWKEFLKEEDENKT